MIEQEEQISAEKSVQTEENSVGKVRKKDPRSIENKLGRQKYHEVLTKKVFVQNQQILDELRWIRHRVKALGENDIDMPMLERFAFRDQVDSEIFQRLMIAGDSGVFPKDVAVDVALAKYHLRYYDVSRRIVRMNKRLHFEVGEFLFEKRGHKWAVTKFGFEVWGKSVSEVEEEQQKQNSSWEREKIV
jgi:hypothetical protein